MEDTGKAPHPRYECVDTLSVLLESDPLRHVHLYVIQALRLDFGKCRDKEVVLRLQSSAVVFHSIRTPSELDHLVLVAAALCQCFDLGF